MGSGAGGHALSDAAPAYRPDIDGLRAIAVGAVVIFHLFGGVLPFGYLGVDVFFVISGFLITTILARESARGDFSIARFYDRRIRRIMPALLFVMAATTAAVCAFYLPADAIGFGKSVLATFAFVSNVYFWRDADYFSPVAATKPLLHTWSLGIEEQFYILFPFVLHLLLSRAGRGRTVALLALATALSFAAAFYTYRVNKDLVAFYLLPMRAWELGLGALVALTGIPRLPPAVGAGALALLVAALGVLDPAWYRPLPPATFAVPATAALIASGRHGGVAARLLGWRPLVAVGLVSYSLYLWHWPVYVLARYLLIREPDVAEAIGLTLFSGALAWLSWRYVERPFRGRAMPFRRVAAIVGAGMVALSLVAVGLIATRGLPQRFRADAAAFNAMAGTHYRCPVTDYIAFGALFACPLALPDRDPASAEVVLYGSSHAQMYAPAVRQVLVERRLTGVLVPFNTCLATTRINYTADCTRVVRDSTAQVARLPRAKVVILAFRWPAESEPLVDAAGRPARLDWRAFYADLSETIARLRAGGKRVILVAPVPFPGYDVASTVGRELAFGRALSPLSEPRARFAATGGGFERWLARLPAGVTVARPAEILCDAARCHYAHAGRPVYADDNHLAAAAMPAFAPVFARAIDQARGD